MVRTAPKVSIFDAQCIAREVYGLEVRAEVLPSERDANFLLRGADGSRYVLKIANTEEPREILEMQNEAISRLRSAATSLEWPRVIAARQGGEIAIHGGHFVRLLTWIEGTCLASIRAHGPELLTSLGRAVAAMDAALAGFDHPAAHREFHWDIRQAGMARRHAGLLSPAQRALVEPIFEAWEHLDWPRLPSSVIHSDANDYNVLVDEAGARVVSVLDFGDMVYSATAANLGVALAYAMLGKQDPIAAAAHVAAGYHATRPLERARDRCALHAGAHAPRHERVLLRLAVRRSAAQRLPEYFESPRLGIA